MYDWNARTTHRRNPPSSACGGRAVEADCESRKLNPGMGVVARPRDGLSREFSRDCERLVIRTRRQEWPAARRIGAAGSCGDNRPQQSGLVLLDLPPGRLLPLRGFTAFKLAGSAGLAANRSDPCGLVAYSAGSLSVAFTSNSLSFSQVRRHLDGTSAEVRWLMCPAPVPRWWGVPRMATQNPPPVATSNSST